MSMLVLIMLAGGGDRVDARGDKACRMALGFWRVVVGCTHMSIIGTGTIDVHRMPGPIV